MPIADINWNYVLWGAGLFVLTFAFSLLAVGFLLVRMPATFFQDRHDRNLWQDRHPALRIAGMVLKNLIG